MFAAGYSARTREISAQECETGGVIHDLSPEPRFARLREFLAPRQWAVDANDGIIATAGLLEGFAGAGASDHTMVTAATAMMVAGSLGLGGAKWAEEAGELDAERRLIAQEQAELAASPETELAELVSYWEGKGLSHEVAQQVAEQLSAKDALAAQLEYEHDISATTPPWQPVWAGLTSGIAFLLGSLVPLLITLFVSVEVGVWAILIAVVLSLTLTSLLAARTGHMSLSRTLTRSVLVGVCTLAVSFVVGMLIR